MVISSRLVFKTEIELAMPGEISFFGALSGIAN
jgi:hypothetical protein